MSSVTSPVFTGVSSYSNDLQNIITRAVGIASLPLHQLEGQLNTLNDRSTALSGLSDKFGALQTAMQGLSGAMGTASLSAQSSDSATASVSVSDGALPDSYTVDITDIGAASAGISDAALPVVADPSASSISSSSSYTLTINGTAISLTPANGSLNALVSAINSSGADVQASLINTGNSGSPSYRLVIRGKSLSADTIQLNDGNADLLDTLNTGKPAQYTIDGLTTSTQSDSRMVTLAPGVTMDLLQQTLPGQPVTITVSRDANAVQSAVSKFVDAYNAAVDALDQQVGQTAGPLSGQNVIYDLRTALSRITQFTQTGTVSSLADMGVTLDKTGKLSLNASQFASKDLGAIQAFLGAADVSGFLQSASQVLNQIEDPLDGTLPSATKLLSDEITQQNKLITVNQQRVDDLQTNLQQQMSAADALLAQLENQKNYFNNLFTAMMNSNLNGAGVKAN